MFFFFKQKTAYEMRISDWSSDVCSSDLASNPTNDHLAPFALWAIVVAFLSATQDIVIDAYRIEILSDAELPHGTAMNQFGYRPGNLIAGVGTIALASPAGFGLGWATASAFTGLAVLRAVLGALFAGPGRDRKSVGGGQSGSGRVEF